MIIEIEVKKLKAFLMISKENECSQSSAVILGLLAAKSHGLSICTSP